MSEPVQPVMPRTCPGGSRATRALAVLLSVAAVAAASPPPAPAPAAAASGGPAPRLEVASEFIELGELGRGTLGEGSITLRNTGEGELKILRAQPACGCTVASYDEVIPAGKEGKLSVKLDTSHLSGDVARAVTVHSNDPARPQLALTVRAKVITNVLMLPDGPIKLVNTPTGQRVQRLLRQEASSPGQMKIDGLKVSAPWIVTRLEKVSAPRPAVDNLPDALPGDWLLDVSLGKAPTTGSTEKLEFSTGLPRQPMLTLPIHVFVVPPITLSTQDLILPRSAPQMVERSLMVNVREGLDPGRLHVEAKPEGLKVEMKPMGPRQFKVDIHWQGQAAGDGALNFELDGENVTLPVRWSPAS